MAPWPVRYIDYPHPDRRGPLRRASFLGKISVAYWEMAATLRTNSHQIRWSSHLLVKMGAGIDIVAFGETL
jgi:hypothetical protein